MSDPPTIVDGQRTIARHPEAPDPERWQGTIDHEQFRAMRWRGPHVESVIKQMDTACGAVPESQYAVTE